MLDGVIDSHVPIAADIRLDDLDLPRYVHAAASRLRKQEWILLASDE